MYEVVISNRSSGTVRRKMCSSREEADQYVERKRESVGRMKRQTFRNYYVEIRGPLK